MFLLTPGLLCKCKQRCGAGGAETILCCRTVIYNIIGFCFQRSEAEKNLFFIFCLFFKNFTKFKELFTIELYRYYLCTVTVTKFSYVTNLQYRAGIGPEDEIFKKKMKPDRRSRNFDSATQIFVVCAT